MGCICPKCKSNNVIPIMHGYPTPEIIEEAEKGNLKLGGFMIYDTDGGGMADRYWSNWGCYDLESIVAR